MLELACLWEGVLLQELLVVLLWLGCELELAGLRVQGVVSALILGVVVDVLRVLGVVQLRVVDVDCLDGVADPLPQVRVLVEHLLQLLEVSLDHLLEAVHFIWIHA